MPHVFSPYPAIALLALLLPAGASELPGPADAAPDLAPLPGRLSETGLYEPGSLRLSPAVQAFTPNFALWSDGAAKRRWISLPPGTAIDRSDPAAWQFPPGTRFWKEFSHAGPVETRLIERLADGTWRYASYVWDSTGTEALLAPAYGVLRMPVSGAPGGVYDIPSEEDCRMCHEGGPVPVLGFSAAQLSTVDDTPMPGNETLARDALGYLHANCAHCHNDRGPLSDIDLTLSVADGADRILQTLVDREADTAVQSLRVRVVPGKPGDSQLVARMKSRNPNHQMPPLGTRVTDDVAVALVERWIEQLTAPEGN